MRQAYKVWSAVAVGVFCVVAATDMAGGVATPPAGTVASSSSLPAAPVAAPVAAPAVAPSAGVAGSTAAESVRVLEVIDGDSFRLASGDEVRVLGIDSCEATTAGGRRATAAARARLVTAPVTLATEPGVDRDRYGRMLRYVSAGGTDFAATMVAEDHTAIYTDGRNDASPTVQATLRRMDTDSRTCGSVTTGTTPPTTTRRTATPAPDVDRPRTARPVVPSTSQREAGSGRAGGSFRNCAAARAAGAAPLRAGQPGYRAALDRDRDGVACE